MTRRLPADVARCDGRSEDHPYYHECKQCLRKLVPPVEGYAWQVWIRGWGGHGECPDKLKEEDK